MELISTHNVCQMQMLRAFTETGDGSLSLAHVPLLVDMGDASSPACVFQIGSAPDPTMFMEYCIRCGQLYYPGYSFTFTRSDGKTLLDRIDPEDKRLAVMTLMAVPESAKGDLQ